MVRARRENTEDPLGGSWLAVCWGRGQLPWAWGAGRTTVALLGRRLISSCPSLLF